MAQVGLLQLGSPVGCHSISTQAALDDHVATVAATAAPAPTPLAPPAGARGAGRKGPTGTELAGSAVAYLPDSVHEDVRALVDATNAEFPNSVW